MGTTEKATTLERGSSVWGDNLVSKPRATGAVHYLFNISNGHAALYVFQDTSFQNAWSRTTLKLWNIHSVFQVKLIPEAVKIVMLEVVAK